MRQLTIRLMKRGTNEVLLEQDIHPDVVKMIKARVLRLVELGAGDKITMKHIKDALEVALPDIKQEENEDDS